MIFCSLLCIHRMFLYTHNHCYVGVIFIKTVKQACINMGSLRLHFWVRVNLKREAVSKCSSCTHIKRLPPWIHTHVPSCISMMFLSVQCDMTVLLYECICSVQNVRISWRWVIRMSCLDMPVGLKSGTFPSHQIPNRNEFASIDTYMCRAKFWLLELKDWARCNKTGISFVFIHVV
jgi:hypothetical protein